MSLQPETPPMRARGLSCETRALAGDGMDDQYSLWSARASDVQFSKLDSRVSQPYGVLSHVYSDGNVNVLKPTNMTTCRGTSAFTGLAQQQWLIGPFVSTGGYDWWDVGMDMNRSCTACTGNYEGTRYVGGYSISFHAGTPATPGEQLGLPPIHNHHSAITINDEMSLPEAGDCMCAGEVDGRECTWHDYASKGFYEALPATNAASMHVSVGGLFNDVRPANSPPLQWYVNFTIEYLEESDVTRRGLRPLGRVNSQHSYPRDTPFGTTQVPTDIDSFVLTEGVWPFTGTLVNDPRLSYFHTHTAYFHYSFLLAASAKELGLEDPKFYSKSGCDPVATASAGFADNAAMLRHLAEHCPHCFAPASSRTVGSGTDTARGLLCRANASSAMVDGLRYDRRSSFECAADLLAVRKGEVYTSISFVGPRPGETFFAGTVGGIEGVFPIHVSWMLYGTSPPDVPAAEQISDASRDQYMPMLLPRGQPADKTRCVSLVGVVSNYSRPRL